MKKHSILIVITKLSIRFIKSTLDFKRTFFKVTIINQNDFTDCITNPWSSFNYYLTDKWEYGNIISKDKAYKAFWLEIKDPYIFALEVFDPSYVDFKNYINGEYLKKIYSAQYQNLEQHKIEFTINRSLSDFYGYPIDFFYLFPRMKHIMIVRALKNKKLIGCIIFNLINKGFSFRKSAEQLGCSHSKLYQLYNEYIKEIMKKDKKQEETCENNDT